MAPPRLDVAWGDTVEFVLNGRRVALRRPHPDAKLISFLRDEARLTGTKLSCGEGGCGACTVVLCHRPQEQIPDVGLSSSEVVFRAVNACLFPVCALDGLEVLTVEGIGSTVSGFHDVQKRLADANGSQCGFCTPGMVMNMYELLRKSPMRSKREIEDHFDGNLCRCTGYRPIFEAFHSFSTEKVENRIPLRYEDTSDQLSNVDGVLSGCEHLEDWLLVDSVETGKRTVCEAKCGGIKARQCEKYLDLEELFPSILPERLDGTAKQEIQPSDFVINFKPRPLKISALDENGKVARAWYRPLSLEQLQLILEENSLSHISFVGGRTAHGVSKYYNNTAPYNRPTEMPVQIELNYIADMKTFQVDETHNNVTVGAAITINSLITFLTRFDNENFDYSVLRELATLLGRVANNQVRNSGTWAGNLSLCREHPSFVSDIVVGLLGIGATLTLLNEKLQREEAVAIDAFLQKPRTDFTIILAMQLPLTPRASDSKRQQLCCYKVAQRPQNAHSHVNCAIWFLTRMDQKSSVCLEARLAFGGVSKYPARFMSTEKFLSGRVMTQQTLDDALVHLEDDLKKIGESDAFGSTIFRLSVTKSLLYKSFLATVAADEISDPSVASAPAKLLRGISTGTQSFKPSDSTAPVSLPIPKIGMKLQVTGEAGYTADKELPPSALYGAILFSRSAPKTLVSIDKDSKTRSMEGVVDIITAADIRGENDISSGTKEEPLFVPVGGVVRCVGAPIALVLAKTPENAELAVKSCEVEYGVVPPDQLWHGQADGEPIVNIDMAIKAGTLASSEPIQVGDDAVTDKLKRSKHTLQGSILLGAQKHFYMEPQVSVVSMQEGGIFLVETSSQFPTFTQQQLAAILNVRYHDVVVQVQRVGGGFGGKLTRSVVNAAAAAVATQKHRQIVRVLNDRSADFRLVGGRENMRGHYTVGFDDDGYIQAVDLRLDVDCGYTVGDSSGSAEMAVRWSDSSYHVPSFRCRAFLYLTNTQTCTSHRAPGVPQSRVLYEAALHHIADFLGLPMRWIQERNLYKDGDRTPYGQALNGVRLHEVWDRMIVSSSVEQREEAIAVFNNNNKWKKRGIACTPTKYAMQVAGRKDGSRVEIFAGDGSVLLSHGGCEIGQGIHTKAAQVCAYELGIPLKLIAVRPTSTDKTPNSEATGGSSTSESVARSIIACCTELNRRLQPIREADPDMSWKDLVRLADERGVSLFAGAQPKATLPSGDSFDYFVYAAACSEVEVDILTGEINILSAEIVYDCGISLNPSIDIGQIEGGFVMGIGLYLQEEVAYAESDGALLTQGTWEYKVPCSKDIPEQFKVTLLENDLNPRGVLNSKATGEPPYALATSVFFAVKNALMESRSERGLEQFFHLDVPATVSRRQEAVAIQAGDYVV